MATSMAPEQSLADIARGGEPAIEALAEMRLDMQQRSGLDPKTYMVARLAALIAMDAAPASYLATLGRSREAGMTPDEARGILAAIAPVVGTARVVSAAGNTLRALGMAKLIEEKM